MLKKLGKEKDFSGLIGEGKFREKLCFIGGETDTGWNILTKILLGTSALFGDEGVQVDNQKDMKRAVLHLVQVFHTHNFGDHIGAI